jgi:heat shock protein HslJ
LEEKMTQWISGLFMLGLFLASSAVPVVAADEVNPEPVLLAVECPAVEYVDGVPVIPEGAPAECMYIQQLPEEEPIPVDSGNCWVSSDGSTNCARGGEEIMATPGRYFSIISISLSGVRFELTSGQMFVGADGFFSATVGCNQMTGTASTDSNGSITVAALTSTEMYCEELSAAEDALGAVLTGGALVFSDNSPFIASNETGTLELAEFMYDTVSLETEKWVGVLSGADGGSSSPSAIAIALILFGFPALVGAGALTIGLSRRD